MSHSMNPKELVMSYQEALGSGEYDRARAYMADEGFSFKGPLASHDKPEGLLKDLEQLHHIVEGVDMKKVFVDGDDVCLLYDLRTKSPSVTSFTCDWYRVKNGKIKEIRVVFDARPFAAMFENRN
jgi:predicted SnoaL-like aldol condensation-catalyzing enzyme